MDDLWVRLLWGAWGVIFGTVLAWFAVLASPVVTVVWLVLLMQSARTALGTGPDSAAVIGPDQAGDTAYAAYFSTQATADLRELWAQWVERLIKSRQSAMKALDRLWQGDVFKNNTWLTNETWRRLLGRPAFLAGWIGLVCGALLGAVCCAIVLGLTWAAMFAVTGGLRLTARLARTADWAQLRIRGIYLRCPHPWCFERITLPRYTCHACGIEHDDLRPGPLGALHRICTCGEPLPTLSMTGRHRLAASCHACRSELPTGLGTSRLVHIPLVGDTSAGKTTVLIAATICLDSMARAGAFELRFASARSSADFDAAALLLRSGTPVAATSTPVPSAFMFELRATGAHRSRLPGQGGARGLIYLYDPMGESFASTDAVRTQRYLAHADGILLVVDPLAVLARGADLPAEYAPAVSAAQPAPGHPMAAYDRVIADLSVRGRRNSRRIPVAVAVSKSDVLRQVAEWGFPASEGESAEIAAWLDATAGLGNLVRSLRKDFRDVTYWGLSAAVDARLARPPRRGTAADPILWLLGRNGLRSEHLDRTR